jgi:hypothetical protein
MVCCLQLFIALTVPHRLECRSELEPERDISIDAIGAITLADKSGNIAS